MESRWPPNGDDWSGFLQRWQSRWSRGPHGGRKRRLGHQSAGLCHSALPTPRDCGDFATSVVAEGKIRVKARNGGGLPPDRILDVNGEQATDPNNLAACLLPLPSTRILPGPDDGFLGWHPHLSRCAVLPTYQWSNGVALDGTQ
ncbi:MAG: Ldh family oxidoreductase [Caldilineaceae bacterium]